MGTMIFLVLVVGIAAWILRRYGVTTVARPAAGESGTEDPEGCDALFDEEDDDEAVAVTSDGWAFVPHRGVVQLLPVGAEEGWGAKTHLAPGDLIAARVKRGAPSIDPWRLEALGRDHDFRAWPFETEEAAKAAFKLVSDLTVRPALDRDGDPIPVGEEDFFVAQRKLDERAAQSSLDLPEEEDEIR